MAFLVGDGSGQVVVKFISEYDDTIFNTVMSYNLAKSFGVKVPSARYIKRESAEGKMLVTKFETLLTTDSETDRDGSMRNTFIKATKLKPAIAMTLWEYMPGEVLGDFEGQELTKDKVKNFRENPENFIKLGKMLVFDIAILNTDRFKLEDQSEANANEPTNANPGNLLIVANEPVGLDQDFAHPEGMGVSMKDALSLKGRYGGKFVEKFKPLLSHPLELASELVKKMVKENKYPLFTGMEVPIATGISKGLETLTSLASRDDTRITKLIEWSKTFNPVDPIDPESDLDAETVKTYWRALLPAPTVSPTATASV